MSSRTLFLVSGHSGMDAWLIKGIPPANVPGWMREIAPQLATRRGLDDVLEELGAYRPYEHQTIPVDVIHYAETVFVLHYAPDDSLEFCQGLVGWYLPGCNFDSWESLSANDAPQSVY